MAWITLRLALAHLLPGFLLMFFVLLVAKKVLDIFLETSAAEKVALITISSIVLGIVIDLFRHKIERHFIKWANLTQITHLFRKMLRRSSGHRTLHNLFKDYEEKERAAVRLYLSSQLSKHTEIERVVEKDDILTHEYRNPNITSGDRWALLNVLDKDSLKWMMEEYFSYYEFSFNCMIALSLCEAANFIFYFCGNIDKKTFWPIAIVLAFLIVVFNESTAFWLLASKRYARKIILFSLIK
jgi:hypothetical protein